MTKTLRECFVEALTAEGCHEVKRTSKYIVFSRNESSFYYIGKSGSLRFGSTIAGSMPVGETRKQQLLALVS